MALLRYCPASPLDRYVECFWWSRREDRDDHAEHMLPSGRAQLVFALHDTPILCRSSAAQHWTAWSRSIVHGPQSSFYLAGPKSAGVTVGVSFRPGAAAAVLGVSMAELADRHVPLDAIWGVRGADLHQQMVSAAGPAQVFRILEHSLSARVHRPLLLHPAVAHALASRSGSSSAASVADMRLASGYSPKHFIALFRSAVGLNPKQYHRILRFNAVVRNLAAAEGGRLVDLAAAAGYSDQSHFTREFQEFAGVSPTRYRPSGVDRPLHHRAAADSLRTPGK